MAETLVRTLNGQVEVRIPPAALPPGVQEKVVEVEAKNVDRETVSPPPPGVVFLRAVEINTFVNGYRQAVEYVQPVILSIPLTAEDLSLAEGDPGRLAVMRYNPDTTTWDPVLREFKDDPPRLEATLTHFSILAIGLRPIAEPTPMPMPTPIPTAPTTPTPTLVPPQPPPAVPAWVWVAVAVIAMVVVLVWVFWWRRRLG